MSIHTLPQALPKTAKADLQQLLSEFQPAEFNPLAYYDKHMDCIRVLVRDCSVTEHRVDRLFTLIEDNFPSRGENKYVGFVIKGVRHLFDELSLPLDGVHRVADILQAIIDRHPDETMAMVTDVLLERLQDQEQVLAVDFAEAA